MADAKEIGELKREAPKNTVRVRIRNKEGKSLLLEKDIHSRAAGMFEWPGGNILMKGKIQLMQL